MPGLFDRLQSHIDKEDPGGITPLDITDLPESQRRIMLLMLRDQTSTAAGITQDSLRAKLGAEIPELAVILKELAKNGWLIVSGDEPSLRYKVNLRRKRGSNAGFGLWSILSDHISRDK
jgi:hypothetical protein